MEGLIVYASALPNAGDYDIGETGLFYSKLAEVLRLLHRGRRDLS
jgi:hypothetical protein